MDQKIVVDKTKLLETIKANREDHRAQFLAAQDKYREACIEALDKRLQEVRNGKPISLGFALPEPQDYTGEYDNAIAMIEWDERGQIDLEPEYFKNLVLNQWAWARHFAASTQSYLAG